MEEEAAGDGPASGRSAVSVSSLFDEAPLADDGGVSPGVPRRLCRICHDSQPENDLVSPCRCKGSVEFVHGACLRRWLKIKFPLLGAHKCVKPSGTGSRDHTQNYCCEICQYTYKLLVSPLSWRQFLQRQLLKSYRTLRQHSWSSLSDSVVRHVRQHSTWYIKYGFHAVYLIYLVSRLRRLLDFRAILKSLWQRLLSLREFSLSQRLRTFSAGLHSMVTTAFSPASISTSLVRSARPGFDWKGLLTALRLSFICTVVSQYAVILLLDIDQLWRELQVAKSRRSTVTLLY